MADYRPAPPPWTLTGRAYAIPLRLPDTQRIAQSGVPETLGTPRGRYSVMMFVDYSDSDVGPYHELLFIPGTCDLGPGEGGRRERHRSIGRIYVSSHDSVINGRLNWGIPKDQAEFRVEQAGRVEHISVAREGKVFCRLTLKRGRLGVPLPGGLIPARLRTLGQVRDGKRFLYTPGASGRLGLGTLLDGWADGEHFPEIQAGKALTGGYLSSFRMTFPLARISDWPT